MVQVDDRARAPLSSPLHEVGERCVRPRENNILLFIVIHSLGFLCVEANLQDGSSICLRQARGRLAEQAGDVPYIKCFQHSRWSGRKTLWQRCEMLKPGKVTLHTMQSRPLLLKRLPESRLVVSQRQLCTLFC